MKTQLTQKDRDCRSESVDVAILMCTYNGAAYLHEQLESFLAQTFSSWTLYVSDDASTDDTLSILADYQHRWGEQKIRIFNGPRQGFGKNFLSLLKRPEVKARYYAFSDQDDVWFSDKLQRSVELLEGIDKQTPGLYCSRTRLIDKTGKVIGFSPLFLRPTSFRNALVQSIAGANTMLVNHAARELLMLVPEDATVVAHDWLTYMIVSACGGKAIYDDKPSLDYRQHAGNLIGANTSFKDRLTRIQKMFSGRFAEWNDANIHILEALYPNMSEASRTTLSHFDTGRHMKLPERIREICKSGVYRQTAGGSITLIIAACLGQL
ncbi:glycosyltransferase family 2 protein [Pseudomonas alliivorans]|nr:glycosyltransferase family 2 protein [Pseudomonas alliivorans]MEE4710930.1 glycosyltransferase family 2 protein [Pseudomonas alliivorans]MEE4724463.1 glycosyltransferase family 2 protein [Pseudomonas alliivorans]MEE4766676.1 glycosyltransferase family 2 protein [Pseudomonas alliivorans]